MRTFPLGWAAVLMAAGCLAVRAGAQELRGAQAVLQLYAARKGPQNPTGGGTGEALLKELEAFPQRAAALPPAQAAGEWLELADRYLSTNFTPQFTGIFEIPTFGAVVGALPPPSTWDTLAARIEARLPSGALKKRGDLYWRMLARLLREDRARLWDDVAALRALLKGAQPGHAQQFATSLEGIIHALMAESGDPAHIVQGLELQMGLPSTDGGPRTVALPDLVTLLGSQRAEAFLRRVLTARPVELNVAQDGATLRLAQRVALAEIARLKAPQWSLVSTLDSMALYQALERRFSRKPARPAVEDGFSYPGSTGSSRELARLCYTFALVAAGKTAPAAALVPGLRGPIQQGLATPWIDQVANSGKSAALNEFLRLSLTTSPDLPWWENYVNLAGREKKLPAAIAFMRSRVAKPTLSAETRGQIQDQLVNALLAHGQEAEAAAELNKILGGKSDREEGADLAAAIRLTRLGLLLGRQEWVDDGARAVAELGSDGDQFGANVEIIGLLEDAGRALRAEQMLLEQLEIQTRIPASQQGGDYSAWLVELAGLYHRAGRHRDVLSLLNEAPGWPAADLRGALTYTDHRDTCLGLMAAAALAAEGKPETAVPILEALLHRRPGYDPAYELLVKLSGEKSLPFLASLYAVDRFEERPLIWKAAALLKAGRLPEAEEAARAAIELDPSDEDARPGRRLQAYAVLADVVEAQKRPERASEYREQVRRMRLAERSDRARDLGLIGLAVTLAREAIFKGELTPCLDGRLAALLLRQGETQRARESLFRMMGHTFYHQGRATPPCATCTQLYQEPLGAEVVEAVFKRRLEFQTPPPPRAVHRANLDYQRGYLREQQNRYTDAVRSYQAAVKHDPDFLQAWARLAAIQGQVRLSQSERLAIGLALTRLDPLSRHAPSALDGVSDLRKVWTAAEAALKQRPAAEARPLYPLSVSDVVRNRGHAAGPQSPLVLYPMRVRAGGEFVPETSEESPYYFYRPEITTPGDQIAQCSLVSLLTSALEQERRQE